MTEFEMLIPNQYHLLGCIYKLLARYDTKTEQMKKKMHDKMDVKIGRIYGQNP